MWCYAQASGNFYEPSGTIVATGYSGNGVWKNDPASEFLVDHGPIPRGAYTILAPVDSPKHGPYALALVPDTGNSMGGRSGFMIHGDNISEPGSASDGCIILPKAIREGIWQSNDHELMVFAGWTNEEAVQDAATES